MKITTTRQRLLASSMICGAFAAFAATSAYAQAADEVQEVVVTGSRIARQDFVAASPIATVTGEQATANADVTLDTYLNTLPQVNPAGTTSSNNPSNNGGQSNINLRGLGANRNLVLVDGRRPMVSNNNLTVDLNTIPQALIQSIEVITGGAGATYGADAVAGVVNMKLRRNFEGIDIRASYSNTTEFWDAEEYQVSAAIGGNFADGRGNAVFGFDRSVRQSISKGQREFAAFATTSTGTPPEGAIRWGSSNPIPLAAIQSLFGQASYGSVAPGAISSSSGTFGFNLDGSLFYAGLANDPARQVANYKYPIDVTVNTRFYPDFYSYNFDAPNLLILPLDRYSFLFNTNYELENGIEFFAQAGWTEYNAATALAPSPLPTVNTRAPGEGTARDVTSALVTRGSLAISPQSFIVPVTNPFLPADLRTLLAARTGDDPNLVGSGATEPFLFGFRPVSIGPRLAYNQNTVVQFLGGVKAPISDNWRFEGYVSRGTTEVDLTQIGNIDTQRVQNILEDPNQNPAGSNGACANQNFFGDRPVSSLCANYILSNGAARTSFEQTIGQAYIAGPVMTLPAGDLEAVLGAEYRGFDYTFRFLSNPGPFSGFNTQDPEAGTTSSRDVFGELLVPIVKDLPYANTVEFGLGARYSESEFMNKLTGTGRSARGSWSYKAELTWEPLDYARVRGSYQRAVREPNFQELFAGGGSAPQVFDPCNRYTQAWTASTATGPGTLRGLCINGRGISPTTGATTAPGSQANLQLEGNPNLDAEKANTWTLGVVLSSPWENQWLERLRGTVDYYNIEVADPILPPDPSIVIAACYNYFGTNPTYDLNYKYCQALPKSATTLSNATIRNPARADGRYPSMNGGVLKTSGLDIQLDYGFEWEWLGLPEWMGSLQANALFTHVMNFEQSDAQDLPIVDYTGTISYFGAGLGTSFPEWKANFNTRWKLGENPYGDFDVGVRARYISSMTNRTLAQFKGESFLGTVGVPTDVKATWYFDADAGWGITDNIEVRIGINNIADLQPRQYAPNVQSGTDPSTYDVVGRRLFGSIKLRF